MGDVREALSVEVDESDEGGKLATLSPVVLDSIRDRRDARKNQQQETEGFDPNAVPVADEELLHDDDEGEEGEKEGEAEDTSQGAYSPDVDDYLEEPSVMDVRLQNGESYNVGDWNSEELRLLYDAVRQYGTSNEALSYISANTRVALTRNERQIRSKVDDLRSMNAEHRNVRIQVEKDRFMTGDPMRGFGDVPLPENGRWRKALAKLERRYPITHKYDLANEAIEEVLNSRGARNPEKLVVSQSMHCKKKGEEAVVDWKKINAYIASTFIHESEKRHAVMPHLTPIESCIVLSMVDEMEREADGVEEGRKRLIRGIYKNCITGDQRSFEPDVPGKLDSVLQLCLDPLRVRDWERLAPFETIDLAHMEGEGDNNKEKKPPAPRPRKRKSEPGKKTTRSSGDDDYAPEE